MYRYKPSRAEVNAALEAYRILYAPLPDSNIRKETEVKKTNETTTETASATETATETSAALAPVTSQEISAQVGGVAALAAVGLSADEAAEVLESLRRLELAFVTFTPVEEVAAKDAPLYLINIVTTSIKTRTPEEQARYGETKPVHAFQFETKTGESYTCLMGANPHRDKMADGFRAAARVRAMPVIGPMLITKRKVPGQIQPAWVFDTSLHGFKVDYNSPRAKNV